MAVGRKSPAGALVGFLAEAPVRLPRARPEPRLEPKAGAAGVELTVAAGAAGEATGALAEAAGAVGALLSEAGSDMT